MGVGTGAGLAQAPPVAGIVEGKGIVQLVVDHEHSLPGGEGLRAGGGRRAC